MDEITSEALRRLGMETREKAILERMNELKQAALPKCRHGVLLQTGRRIPPTCKECLEDMRNAELQEKEAKEALQRKAIENERLIQEKQRLRQEDIAKVTRQCMKQIREVELEGAPGVMNFVGFGSADKIYILCGKKQAVTYKPSEYGYPSLGAMEIDLNGRRRSLLDGGQCQVPNEWSSHFHAGKIPFPAQCPFCGKQNVMYSEYKKDGDGRPVQSWGFTGNIVRVGCDHFHWDASTNLFYKHHAVRYPLKGHETPIDELWNDHTAESKRCPYENCSICPTLTVPYLPVPRPDITYEKTLSERREAERREELRRGDGSFGTHGRVRQGTSTI